MFLGLSKTHFLPPLALPISGDRGIMGMKKEKEEETK